MNIAILTQPICNNYGGILQNYALQTILERRGHTITTLNNPVIPFHYSSQVRHFLSICRRVIRKISGDPAILWLDLQKEYRLSIELAQLPRTFIDRHLHIVDVIPPITREQIQKQCFDAFVVGSDQVWRPRYSKHLTNMFLDFTEGLSVRRVAYAASFGTDNWEIPANQTDICAQYAAKFDAISVREASGVMLCRDYLGVDAVQVLDPTLMLSADDYLSLCSGKEYPQGDYIAVYLLDYSKQRLKLLEEVRRRLNLPLHYIGKFTKKGFPSVESWLEGIANAKYVITDSFHGTVFSIIFQRQFVTLGNGIRGNSRFDSLFTILGIQAERHINEHSTLIDTLQKPVDYNNIYTSIIKLQQYSDDYLKIYL